MCLNYTYQFETSEEITDEGLLNLIARTFEVDTSGFKVENIDTFHDENGENYIVVCSKEEEGMKTIKVFHTYSGS